MIEAGRVDTVRTKHLITRVALRCARSYSDIIG